jgi:riboflavin kinase / FMN adenylyltransferase
MKVETAKAIFEMKPRFENLINPEIMPETLMHPVVAIGNFDGMHWGHRQLIDQAIAMASRTATPAAILTFEPHPRSFFQANKPFFRLTSPEQKARLAETFGLNGLITLSFNADLAALSAETFMRDILVGKLGISGAIVGYDFHFGKGRAGSPEALKAFGSNHGFETAILKPQEKDGEIVSSSLIRQLLSEGDVARANAMLGHIWGIAAEVRHGDKRGRLLGYPTANLHLDPAVTLKHGIYAVRASVDGVSYPAVASFGRRPTFDDGAPRLEVHLFDVSLNLYGKMMDVDFVGYIRSELKFNGVEPLIQQMNQDSLIARKLLASKPLESKQLA